MPYSVMIKPASSTCNLHCRYCFYADEVKKRQTSNFGMMSVETAESVIRAFVAEEKVSCSFAFQGGEPLLVGLPFFEKFAELEKKYNTYHIPITHAVQTNGLALNDSWARFFAKNQYLLGVSVDGTSKIHDTYRVDTYGKGSYEKVRRGIKFLDEYDVPYNILTVVTGVLAKHPEQVYREFVKNGWKYQQYIPCMEALEWRNDANSTSFITVQQYGIFLKRIFDVWFKLLSQGQIYSIRFFDNLIGILCGHSPELCSMAGKCTVQFMIEANGNVYPCDFYGTDEWCLGNINEQSLSEIDQQRKRLQFIEESLHIPKQCKNCEWLKLCRNGCRRERDEHGVYRYCRAYQDFFPYAIDRLKYIAASICS